MKKIIILILTKSCKSSKQKELKYKMDINTLHKQEDDREVRLNDIARVSLQVSAPLHYDRYRRNRATGSFILIDEQTNNTVAAGMIVG